MNNMIYVFKPSQSGNFEESSMVCEAENMSLLEVRDKISYEAVKKQALATGQDVIWLNIRRLNIAKKASERHVKLVGKSAGISNIIALVSISGLIPNLSILLTMRL